jgi:hypothetical protein
VLVDADEQVVDRLIKNKANFDIDKIAYSDEGTMGVCVYGHYLLKELTNSAVEMVRKAKERCDSVDSIIYVTSVTGGTSGVASGLIEADREQKTTKALLGVYPSNGMKNNVVQDYNCILSTMDMHESTDMTMIV